jgi:hypothetical protein
MPHWVVVCPNCTFVFSHTRIELDVVAEFHRDPYQILSKPIITQVNERRTCPNCTTESVFKPFDLFYREDLKPEPA